MVALGVEEELQVIDRATGALVSHRAGPVAGEAGFAGGITAELHQCAIETQSPVCATPCEVVRHLALLRGIAAARCQAQDQRIVAAGLHPFSTWCGQRLNRSPHYDALVDEYQQVARGALSFGLHIHLGMADDVQRVRVLNGLRPVLPVLLALSASAPFHEGVDTGLASWRHSLLDRYPRMGTPEAWPSPQAYWDHLRRLRQAGRVGPDAGMWEDARLHHRYPTVEVRICDQVPSLDRVWLMVALLQCEAIRLIEGGPDPDAPQLPSALINENRWLARRYGMSALLVDWEGEATLPVAAWLERWLAAVWPIARRLGIAQRLELGVARAIAEGDFASRQRQLQRACSSWAGFMSSLADLSLPDLPLPSRGRRRVA